MQLKVPLRDADDLDYSFDGDWEQLCCDQVLPESLDDIEEGDAFAMEDRKNDNVKWPGRRVFVGFDENVWIFDENGELFNDLSEAGAEDEFMYKPLSFAHFKHEFNQGYFRFGVLEEPPLEGWRALVVPGARVQMAFGCPPHSAVKWEGALVGRQRDAAG